MSAACPITGRLPATVCIHCVQATVNQTAATAQAQDSLFIALIPKRCSPKPRGCAGRPTTRARWRRHRGQAGPLPRVQATATGDGPGFGMRGNGSLGPLTDPDSGGVLGAAGALPAGAGGRALFFAVAATKYMTL